MASNYLEDLVTEWYQFRGFFVRRNVQVGKRLQGGYDCELDVVAFHPQDRTLVHIEPSADADSWATREQRYLKKFQAGQKHIPTLFPGLNLPAVPEQIALFAFGATKTHTTVGGGKVLLIKDFMLEILAKVRQMPTTSAAIPEQYPLLRTLQFAAQYWPLTSSAAVQAPIFKAEQ